MTKRVVLAIAAVCVTACAAYAETSVTNVTMTQRENSRFVDITYDLTGEAAIVTLSIETNGVAIPDSAVTRLSGDVCKVVDTGAGKSIEWNAGADWPEHLVTNAQAWVTAWQTNLPPQVMVIDLSKGIAATETDPYPVFYYTSLDALPGGGLSNAVYQTHMLVLNKIPSGFYAMGDESTTGASIPVTLTKPFYAGVYQVTQKQWYKVMGKDPSYYKGSSLPVHYGVSYSGIRGSTAGAGWPTNDAVDADSFIGKIRDKTGVVGFDLPTDAQWEYACRAGTDTYFNDGIEGSSTSQLNELGWHGGNSGGSPHPVGQKTPNAWRLYDMHGNAFEWCLDWYRDTLAGGADPQGPESGSASPPTRVLRGGSYTHGTLEARSAKRMNHNPLEGYVTIGFRLFRNLP